MKNITPIEADKMLEKNEAILLDVRDIAEYNSENIDGAINHPLGNLNVEKVKELSAGKTCIIQCLSGVRAGQAYEQIKTTGIDCCVLEGGIKGWKESKLPTNKNSNGIGISLMRQVQIAVGGSVFIGSILAMISPGFIWIPLFFGAGLLFAGVSGFCGMLKVLAKMPWNK